MSQSADTLPQHIRPAAHLRSIGWVVRRALLGIFALGLVNRYDLVKLRSVPLPGALLNRVRVWMLSPAERLAGLFEPRRVP